MHRRRSSRDAWLLRDGVAVALTCFCGVMCRRTLELMACCFIYSWHRSGLGRAPKVVKYRYLAAVRESATVSVVPGCFQPSYFCTSFAST